MADGRRQPTAPSAPWQRRGHLKCKNDAHVERAERVPLELDGLGRGTMLDLGPAWQTTLSFFIERGFRVTSDDLLRSWKEFMIEEEARLKNAVEGSDSVDVTPAGRATRFIEENLRYKEGAFDAVLLWDILDYLEPAVASRRWPA